MAVVAAGTCPSLQLHEGGRKASSTFLGDLIPCHRASLSLPHAFLCRARVPSIGISDDGMPWDRATKSMASSSDCAVSSRRRTTTWEDENDSDAGSEDGKVLYVDSGAQDNADELAIANLGVAREIVDSLADRGISHLFPIQRAVFEPATKGVDLIARAKTGTGKTLAFGIPIMDRIYRERNKLARRSPRGPAALILAPTRELAKQVEKEFMESGKGLATVCVYGGVSIISQKRLLSRGVDVAVGTPGRIIDLLEQGSLDLSEVQYLVLDEADQMLAVGFEEDVEKIMEQLPSKRQNMLFSATMPSWVQKLSRKFMNRPLTIDLVGDSDEKLAEGIKLFAVQASQAGKRTILSDVITVYGKGGKTIVFTQTKRDAEEVSMTMNRTLGCEALHGDIAQFQREKTLAAFREGKFLILIATDVAARGLDITNVDLVIHYDLPRDSETFVHRSGRTGRAGKEGSALVLYSMVEKRAIRQIERDVGCSFEHKSPPQFEEVLNASSTQAVELIKSVHAELKDVFFPTAEKLLEEHGTGAFAAAIAYMSGFSQPPASRSLITLEPGWITLKFTRAKGSGLAVRHVVGVIAGISEKAADNIGKIQMIDKPNVQGAVFDLPEDIAKDLLSRPVPSGDSIEMIKELPNLQESFDSFQRTSQFGGRGRRSFNRSDNDKSGSGYGGRSSGRFSSFGSGRSSYGGNGGNRSFGGACYKCGQSGHRASDCKVGR